MRRSLFACACLLLAAGLGAAEVTVTDAFAGTLAKWDADEFNWQVVDGRLQAATCPRGSSC